MQFIDKYVPVIFFYEEEPLELAEEESEADALEAIENKVIEIDYPNPNEPSKYGAISHCEVKKIYRIEK